MVIPKKKFNRMIVVAGLTCCGKTTFINQLVSGKLSNIEELLQINNFENWIFQDAFFLNKKQFQIRMNSSEENVIFHWTIPLPNIFNFTRKLLLRGKYDKITRIRFVEMAKEVNVLTLYADPHILLKRLSLRATRWYEILKENNAGFFKKLRVDWSISSTRKFYLNYHLCFPAYIRWFQFVDKVIKPKKNFLLDVSYSPVVRDRKELLKIRNPNNMAVGRISKSKK